MTTNYTLRQLDLFVAAADLGSVSAAATSVGASQAGVSLAIRDLERHLGVQLFVRRRAKGVALTSTGSLVLAYARQVLESAEALQQLAAGAAEGVRGVLNVGCYQTLAPILVPQVLDDFAGHHPALQVKVTEGTAESVRAGLLEGRYELGILYESDGSTGMNHVPVRVTRPYVILAADHPLARRNQVHLAELANEPLIMIDAPSARNASVMLSEAGVQPEIRHLSSNIEVVRGLVARGVGYSIMVQRWPSDLSHEGKPIASVQIADDIPERVAVLAWPEHSRLTQRAAALVSYFAASRTT